MCQSMVDIRSTAAEIRRGKKRRRKERNYRAKIYMVSLLHRATINKTRYPLKYDGVPQTRQSISAVSGPNFTILSGLVEEVLLLNKFFPIVDTCLSCEDMARQSCATVPRWRFLATFLRPVFPASRAQHVSDLHSKFTLGPHHVPKYGRHPIYGR